MQSLNSTIDPQRGIHGLLAEMRHKLPPTPVGAKLFVGHVAGATLVMGLAIWLSSGTMAPYAATFDRPLVLEPCRYLANIDHEHFRATFSMLDGAERSTWEFSVVLRRILFPLLAFPAMKLLGFESGGFVTSLLLHIVTLLFFAGQLRRRFGEGAAVLGAWLLATYPGVTYWAALPYSYATIVPCSLLGMSLLWQLDESERPRRAFLLGLAMGSLFFAYDLLPFFGPAVLLMLAWQKCWRRLACAMAGIGLAQLAGSALLLLTVGKVAFANPNTASYVNILRSYLGGVDFAAWWELLRRLPSIAWEVYIYSNFAYLPRLFVGLGALAAAVGAWEVWSERPARPIDAWQVFCRSMTRNLPLGPAELSLLAATAALFLFNNAAPQYPGWQLRGTWIPRLYQPVFVVLVGAACGAFLSARSAARVWQARLVTLLSVAAIVANSAIAFGPLLRNPQADNLYHRFYQHSNPGALLRNLDTYGRRPLGFCAPTLAEPGHFEQNAPPRPFGR